jgi:hypothetical protein
MAESFTDNPHKPKNSAERPAGESRPTRRSSGRRAGPHSDSHDIGSQPKAFFVCGSKSNENGQRPERQGDSNRAHRTDFVLNKAKDKGTDCRCHVYNHNQDTIDSLVLKAHHLLGINCRQCNNRCAAAAITKQRKQKCEKVAMLFGIGDGLKSPV